MTATKARKRKRAGAVTGSDLLAGSKATRYKKRECMKILAARHFLPTRAVHNDDAPKLRVVLSGQWRWEKLVKTLREILHASIAQRRPGNREGILVIDVSLRPAGLQHSVQHGLDFLKMLGPIKREFRAHNLDCVIVGAGR